jgi:MFS family permease
MFTGLGFVLLALSPSYAWAVAAAIVGAVASPAVHVALDTYIGENVPQHAHAHVFAFQQFVMSGLGAVGLGIMGLIYQQWQPADVLSITGGLVVAAVVGLARYSRKLGSPANIPAASDR